MNPDVVKRFDFQSADTLLREYVNMERAAQILKLALIASDDMPLRKNVLFFGPGGYGKSEFVPQYIAKATRQNVHVQNMHKEYSLIDSYGNVNVPDLQAGRFRYNLDQSWMNHEYSVWEEALDAPDSTLLGNKDPITRRIFTNGENFEIKTRLIVINTNHDASRLTADLSKAAFLERFPYRLRVDWSNLTIFQRKECYVKITEFWASKRMTMTQAAIRMLSEVATTEMWSPRVLIQAVTTCQDMAALYGYTNVREPHVYECAKLLGFDTADAISKLQREEHLAKIAEFKTAWQTLIQSYNSQLDKAYEYGKSHRGTPGALDKISAGCKKILVNLDELQFKCKEVRTQYGDDSNAIVDETLSGIEMLRMRIGQIALEVMTAN